MTLLGQATPIRETEKALLFSLEHADGEYWIPKSVIHDDSECYSMKSGPGDLIVEDWWAEKHAL